MAPIRYLTDSYKGKLIRSQIAVFAACALITLAILLIHGRLAVLLWREQHPRQAQATTSTEAATPTPTRSTATPSRQQAQVQPTAEPQEETAAPVVTATAQPTAAPLADHAAVSTEELGSEVSRVIPTLIRWQPVAVDPAQMKNYSGMDMEELEGWKSSTFARNATDRWRMPDVPTLAGSYQRGRVVRSNWPRAGSLAVELTPLDADPTGQAGPWRVVLFIAASSDADVANAVQYAGTYANEKLSLGKAGLPAVPVSKERTGTDGITFYCVVPAQATATISGTKVTQSFSAPVARPSNGPIPAGNGFR